MQVSRWLLGFCCLGCGFRALVVGFRLWGLEGRLEAVGVCVSGFFVFYCRGLAIPSSRLLYPS